MNEWINIDVNENYLQWADQALHKREMLLRLSSPNPQWLFQDVPLSPIVWLQLFSLGEHWKINNINQTTHKRKKKKKYIKTQIFNWINNKIQFNFIRLHKKDIPLYFYRFISHFYSRKKK